MSISSQPQSKPSISSRGAPASRLRIVRTGSRCGFELLRQQLADGFQLCPALRGGFGICHLEAGELIKNNLRNDQAGILFVVGGNHVPGSLTCACRLQTSLIGFFVMRPVFPFVNVREAEFPVFLRVVDAREEPFALLFPRKM